MSSNSILNYVVVKFDHHRIMTRVLATENLCYSGAISEAALLSDYASTPAALMLTAIPELPHSEDFNSAQDNPDNISSLISTFNHTTEQIITDLRLQLHSLIFLYIHNMTPPVWAITDRRGFLCMQSNNQVTIITAVTTNLHMQIMRL